MELNMFTDASITKTLYNEIIGCAGAICLEHSELNIFEIVRDATNNISEISAIRLAVMTAINCRYEIDKVNIWSDSQLSVFGLTKWNRKWMQNADNYVLKNYAGEDVKNQQIFLCIMKLIVENKLRVNFYHTKGHVDVNSVKSINHAISVFNKSNGIGISRDNMYIAANMNNKVDELTRNELAKYKNAKPVTYIRGIINPILSKEDLDIYYNLVTLGGNPI